MTNFSSKMGCALLLSSIVFLPSCQWLKEKLGLQKGETTNMPASQGGTVLATMEGKPLLTSDEFEKQFKNLIETHPYGAMLAQMKDLDRRFFDGLVSQKVMTRYIEEKGIDKKPEYKQQLDALIQMLNTRFFQMEHQPAKVTEAEMREFYEKSKESMPEAVMSRGGINATGVSFSKEADAKAFLEKAKGKGATLEKVAKDTNLADKYRDFKMVNASSPIDPILRDKIVAIKKFPSLELIKVGDNNYYVVYAAGKEEPKYRSFDELKDAIEQRLMSKKQEEALEKAIEQLKKDYHVTVNEDYFTKKAASRPNENEIMNEEQLEMVMPETAQESAQAKSSPSTKAA